MLVLRSVDEDWRRAVDDARAVVVVYLDEPAEAFLHELATAGVGRVEYFAFIGPRAEDVHDHFDRHRIERRAAIGSHESDVVPMTAWSESGSFEEGARAFEDMFLDAMSLVGDIVVIAPEGARRLFEVHERVQGVVRIDEMLGESDEETAELHGLLERARAYLLGHRWCRAIVDERYGMGAGRIFAVFLFRIEPAGDEDEWLWVVCGDLPTAYLVLDEAPTPAAALAAYCGLMDDWIAAVRTSGDLREVYPVAAEPTLEHARMLETRIALLREEVLRAPAGPEVGTCE